MHASFEASEFGARSSGLDRISVGPTIQPTPSPDTRLEIARVGKDDDLLVAALYFLPVLTSVSVKRSPGG
jgi:hypothetical protein